MTEFSAADAARIAMLFQTTAWFLAAAVPLFALAWTKPRGRGHAAARTAAALLISSAAAGLGLHAAHTRSAEVAGATHAGCQEIAGNGEMARRWFSRDELAKIGARCGDGIPAAVTAERDEP